jgi:hypothetical protein
MTMQYPGAYYQVTRIINECKSIFFDGHDEKISLKSFGFIKDKDLTPLATPILRLP